MKSFAKLSVALALAALSSPEVLGQARVRAVPAPAANAVDDGQWLMPAKNYASTRFSAMNQINRRNVGALSVAFTFSTGINKGVPTVSE